MYAERLKPVYKLIHIAAEHRDRQKVKQYLRLKETMWRAIKGRLN